MHNTFYKMSHFSFLSTYTLYMYVHSWFILILCLGGFMSKYQIIV